MYIFINKIFNVLYIIFSISIIIIIIYVIFVLKFSILNLCYLRQLTMHLKAELIFVALLLLEKFHSVAQKHNHLLFL